MNENLLESQGDVIKKSKLKKFYETNKILIFSTALILIIAIASVSFYLEAQEKIQKKMDDIPEVLDSRPQSFKQPPQPGYRFREGEKWVKIGTDGEMEFEDIEIKE